MLKKQMWTKCKGAQEHRTGLKSLYYNPVEAMSEFVRTFDVMCRRVAEEQRKDTEEHECVVKLLSQQHSILRHMMGVELEPS